MNATVAPGRKREAVPAGADRSRHGANGRRRPDTRAAEILLADVNPETLAVMAYALRQSGFTVRTVHTCAELKAQLQAASPRLIVVDIRLDGMQDFQLLQEIRAGYATPVLMLSRERAEGAIIAGLDQGADDWLAGPFNHRVFLARVRALLRRCCGDWGGRPERPIVMREGDIELDLSQRHVRKRGMLLSLTNTEFRMLAHLMARAGAIVEHSALMLDVWGFDDPSGRDAIRVTLHRLRTKIEDDPGRPRYLHTVPGIGIMFGLGPMPVASGGG